MVSSSPRPGRALDHNGFSGEISNTCDIGTTKYINHIVTLLVTLMLNKFSLVDFTINMMGSCVLHETLNYID